MEPKADKLVQDLQISNSQLQDGLPGARERLISQAYGLIAALELPSESIQRMGWAEPARLAHCQIAVDLNMFEKLARHGPEGVEAGALARECGASEKLISRMLKHLASMNVVEEIASGRYAAGRLARAFTETRFRDGIKYVNQVAGPSFQAMPKYLKTINYDNPTSLADGPFQYAHKTSLPFFGWLGENPEYLSIFSSYMSAYRAGKPSWADPGFYPVIDLVEGFDKNVSPVILVDVGGGLGHDLVELKAKHPNLPGEIVLQDQADVISKISEPVPFKPTAHDFFTKQPVEHARSYYLHSVLHDWSDDECVRILSNIASVMKPGYSRVLINEIVVPDRGANWSVTSMDWLMLALGAMRERMQSDWEAIILRAGLKVSNIYTFEMGTESLIEAELA